MVQSSSNYNMETRKVLTFQNFHFLSLTNDDTPPEPIEVLPDVPLEGEPERSTLLTSGNNSDSLKQKQGEKEEPQKPRRTRGICIDYRYLHNPFPDEDDDAN